MDILTTIFFASSGLATFFTVFHFSLHKARKKNRYSPFTEKILCLPGRKLRDDLADVKLDIFEKYMQICLPLLFLAVIHQHIGKLASLIYLFACLVVTIFSIKKLFNLFDRMYQLNLGLDGEEYTGQELNYLMRQGAWVYHDLAYQYGNIDHVVVSQGGVFAVETKAVRKPSKGGKRQSQVTCKNGKLHFPHVVNGAAIQQAKCHARALQDYLNKKTGKQYPVTPVVALPGWFVSSGFDDDCLVINPKRGGALKTLVEKSVIPADEARVVAHQIESYARNVESRAGKVDPNAGEKYTFWLDKKYEEPSL